MTQQFFFTDPIVLFVVPAFFHRIYRIRVKHRMRKSCSRTRSQQST